MADAPREPARPEQSRRATGSVRGRVIHVVDRIARAWPTTRQTTLVERDLAEARRENVRLSRQNVRLREKLQEGQEIRGQLNKERETSTRLRRRIHRLENETAVATLPESVADTVTRARAEHLTFLQPAALADLAHVMMETELRGLEGAVVECGTARGGSAIVLASAKAPERPMVVYDVFGIIPAPSDRDGGDVHERYETIVGGRAHGPGGELYYGYRNDLYGEVVDSFVRLGYELEANSISLVKGLFQDTIAGDTPVALAHLDGDWYESTKTCLERLAPRLVRGGRLVVDDYFSWSGCRDAVEDFLAQDRGLRRELRTRLHLVRD
ncbi:hypothetical protein GCM10023221_14340 [Luteimicrobium xylanilyticum]